MKIVAIAFVLFLNTFVLDSQSETAPAYWPIEQRCVPPAEGAITDYPGVIFTYEPDVGVRASRADLASSYFVAFEGTNFTGAAAISTDGQWIAIPAGYLSVVSSVDETYNVNEIRVQSTAPGTTRIAARLPWRASYRGADARVVRSMRWLDDIRFLYAEDDWERDTEALVAVQPFADNLQTYDSPRMAAMSAGLSSDLTRSIGVFDHQYGLFDVETGVLLYDLMQPRYQLLAWSQDSAFAALTTTTVVDGQTTPQLALLDVDGATLAIIAELQVGQIVWAPDNAQFAFSAYDPERDANITYIGDINSEILIDTCLAARQGDVLTGPGLAWSPNSQMLAIMTGTGWPLQLLDVETLSLAWVENHTETITSYLLGWYDILEN